MLGRSMGGGVTLNALVAKPGLVKAGGRLRLGQLAVPRQLRPLDAGRAPGGGGRVLPPSSARRPRSPGFYARAVRAAATSTGSPRRCCCTTAPPTTPARSPGRAPPSRLLREAGVRSRLDVYDGEQHAFGPQWPESMRRTVAFLRRELRLTLTVRCLPGLFAARARVAATVAGITRRGRGMTGPHDELHDRRLDAVRAWTAFVEHGDDATAPGPARDPRLLAALRGGHLAATSPRRRWPTSPTPGRSGRTRRCRPRSSGSRPSSGVPPRTATWSSRSPTPRPASSGRTAAG